MATVWRLLIVLLLAVPPGAQAAPVDAFFSEVVEGSGNNQALEIFNGSGAAIDLGAGGYRVQLYFGGASTPGRTIDLVGTVAGGDVFVLGNAAASAGILAHADQSAGGAWFDGDDAIVLLHGAQPIDVIGQIGFDPGAEWGNAFAGTADSTLRRKGSIRSGDPVGSDAFLPAVEWKGFAKDSFDGLGAHALDVQTVPEPGTLALLAAGLAASFGVRRARMPQRRGATAGGEVVGRVGIEPTTKGL